MYWYFSTVSGYNTSHAVQTVGCYYAAKLLLLVGIKEIQFYLEYFKLILIRNLLQSAGRILAAFYVIIRILELCFYFTGHGIF